MQTIKEQRIALGITQEQLAKQLGVTQGAIAQWEKGVTNPSFKMLPRLAEALGISVDKLFGKEAS